MGTTDADRWNVSIGFLLVAHLDALFDPHLLTVGVTRAASIAPSSSQGVKLRLGITESLKLRRVLQGQEPFLWEHRGRFQAKHPTTA